MFRKVIVGVDAGPASRDAIAVGRLLAADGAEIALAHVYELTPLRGGSGAYGAAENADSMALLEEHRSESGVEAELLPITASSIGRGLHYAAETHGADLLVVGSNARGLLGRVLLGDATRAALIGAPCAVAVAPLGYAAERQDAGGPRIARVGVGYDGSPESAAALACARELAAVHGAEVSALTVVAPSHAANEELLGEARSRLAALDGVAGEAVLGDAGEELAMFAGTVDLLVIGSRGYGPIRRLMLGSTSVHLGAHARSPLLVLERRASDAA